MGYTPPHLAERILKSRSALEGEHKQVTVLFCDLSGSTTLAEALGPEDMHDLLNQFFELALEQVHRFEGTINQFLGDGFMALFGAPLALERHERHAVLAAQALRQRLHERFGETGQRPGVPAVVGRMGVNTGLVVVGKIGDNLRMDYTALGDTTNVAARLQTLAEPGAILISDSTYRRVQSIVEVEPLGPVTLRGKTSSVAVYQLNRLKATRSPLAGAPNAPLTPFVGREAELALLDSALLDVERGRSQAIGILGEPGMGKTRLLLEFRRRLEARSVTFLEGQCLSYGSGIPYLPVLDLVRANCRLEQFETPEEVATKVRAAITEVGLDPQTSAPPLLHLLGVQGDGDERLARHSPESIKAATFETLRQLCLRGSRMRPLVLLVEDLHWIDQTSEEFLASLADSLIGSAILLLTTYRPGYSLPWLGKSYSTQVPLRPLSEADGLALILSTDRQVPDQMAAVIVDRSEGNPLFLEELTLAASAGTSPGPTAVPATLQGLLTARIDRLPDDSKHLLQLAAIVGREFSVDLLRRVWARPDDLDERLRALVRLELVYERNAAGGVTYVFKHALTRDAAYGSLLERQRRVHHASVGHALEELHAGRTQEVVELLAHHFDHSDDSALAVEYLTRAADRAQRRWANAESLAYWEAARRRLAGMPDEPANQLLRIDAVLKQSEVRFVLGQHTEHLQTLESIGPLVAAAGDVSRRAIWHYWVGYLRILTGSRPEAAIAHCHEAARIAGEHGLEEIGAYVDTCLAQAYLCAGRLADALAAGERALAVFERLGNRWWAFRALAQLSSIANAFGYWERGFAYCRRTLEHSQVVNDLRLKVTALARAASTHIQQGDPEPGLALCAEAIALKPTPFDAAAIRAIQGYGLIKSNRAAEGVAAIEEALTWWDRSNLRYTRSLFALWLAEGLLALGDRPRAREVVEEVLTTSRHVGYRHLEGVALRLLGESALPDNALGSSATLDAAVELLRQVDARVELAKALHCRADAAAVCGQHESSEAFRRQGNELLEALAVRRE
jgi:class 3 adenylate cyclase/tetratricopeptide (TPR) repeat protein